MGNRAATPAGRRRAAARTKRPAQGVARRPAARRVAAEKPAKQRIATKTRAPKKQAAKKPASKKPAAKKRSLQGGRSKPAPRKGTPKWLLRALPRPRLPRVSWAKGLTLVLGLTAALAAGYFAWFRDSSLVAVTKVEVGGVRSGDREAITSELTRAAEKMTTLHVSEDRLAAAVASFPTVESVDADASFPHGLRIEVTERPPTLVAVVAGEETAVAADGTLLPGIEPAEGLPRLDLDGLPQAGHLEGEALQEALIVGAAPAELAPLIERISYSAEVGVELRMSGGVELHFGSGARAPAKWVAAAAVLADPRLESATYLDLRVPERPAVGGSGAEVAVATDPATQATVSTEG